MIGVKNIIYVIAILLFVLNYQICDYFYYVDGVLDSKGWWSLKSNMYAVIIGLILYGSYMKSKGLNRLILSIGMGMAVSNIIDKCFFNVLEFRYNDIIMIILTISCSLYEYLNNYQNAK